MKEEIRRAIAEAIRHAPKPTEVECRLAALRGKLVADLRRLFQTRKRLTTAELDCEIAQLVNAAFAEVDNIIAKSQSRVG